MQIFIIPELSETKNDWIQVISPLEKVGYAVTFFEYPAPKDDDLEEQTNLAEQFLTQKTIVVGSGVGGRIAIQLLARKNHHVIFSLLLNTPSLPHGGWRAWLMSLLALLTLPIRLFLSYKFKKRIWDIMMRLYYRTPEALHYQKVIGSDQESLLLIIKTSVRIILGSKRLRFHPQIGAKMATLLTFSDIITIDGAEEPLNKHVPLVVANFIDEHARAN